jgi:hypothetical protein
MGITKTPDKLDADRLNAAWKVAAALDINLRAVDVMRSSLAKEPPVVTAIGQALVRGLVDGTVILKPNKVGATLRFMRKVKR